MPSIVAAENFEADRFTTGTTAGDQHEETVEDIAWSPTWIHLTSAAYATPAHSIVIMVTE